MNISKVYYEELKSKCVGGKWESVRIGAEAQSDGISTPEYCLTVAKEFVRRNIDKEGYSSKDNIEKLTKEVVNVLEKYNK